MPTYHYRCGKCAHEFDQFQSIMDDALTDCPECDGKVVRVISGGAGVIFKGSGFYQTDYRSEEYKSRQKAEKSPSAADTKNNKESKAKKKETKKNVKD